MAYIENLNVSLQITQSAISASYILGAVSSSSYATTASFVTSASYALSSSYALSASNALASISASYLSGSNAIVTNLSASTIYVSNTASSSFLEELYGNVNNFTEVNIQNLSYGNTASSDLVVTNNLGNESQYYADLGINGSGWTGSIGYTNDAYLYVTSSATASLYIGNTNPSGSLYLFAGGTTNTASVAINPYGQISCSVITASLYGTSSWASNATSASYSTSGSYALSASNGISATYAPASTTITASWANNALNANTASYITTAQTASYVSAGNISGTVTSSSYSTSGSYALSASNALAAITSSYITTAQTASYVSTAQTASYISAANVYGQLTGSFSGSATGSFYGTASQAITAAALVPLNNTTAGFATVAQTANVASQVSVTSYSSATPASYLTFCFGSSNQTLYENSSIAVNPSNASLTASTFVGNLTGTATNATNAVNATSATSASWTSASLSGSVTQSITSQNYYFDLSAGTTGLQYTYVTTASTYNPVTNQISGSSLGITASHYGTSSWATLAQSGSVTQSITSQNYYFDLSAGTTGYQPTYLTTASTYNPVTNQISGSGLGITASMYGTASMAVTSSFGTMIPQIQAGQFSCSAVTAFSVSFNRAFPNTNYVLQIEPSGSNFFPISGSRISNAMSTLGFTASFASAYTGYAQWLAVSTT